MMGACMPAPTVICICRCGARVCVAVRNAQREAMPHHISVQHCAPVGAQLEQMNCSQCCKSCAVTWMTVTCYVSQHYYV